MTQISAKVVADSVNEFGNRLTTLLVVMPRYILAEFNTHRMLSKNSASSRAIPFEKMVQSVKENPFIPIAWQKDHKGMQGTEYKTGLSEIQLCINKWLEARDNAVQSATLLNKTDLVTKQLCNRLLEPFMWHTVLITATEWENFFALRCPQYDLSEYFLPATSYKFRSKKDAVKAIAGNDLAHEIYSWDQIDWLQANKGQAEIHIQALAELMWDAYNESTPKQLKEGEWHIPFGDNIILNVAHVAKTFNDAGGVGLPTKEHVESLKVKIATARCARVSYTVVGEEGKPDNYENDIKLHDRLAQSGHWSPFEHCAKAMNHSEYHSYANTGFIQNNPKDLYTDRGISGNFKGFLQYRKMFNNENITK